MRFPMLIFMLLLTGCFKTNLIVEAPTVINIPGKSAPVAKQISIPDEPTDHLWNIYIISSEIGGATQAAVFDSHIIDDAKFNEEVPLRYFAPWDCSFEKSTLISSFEQVTVYCRSEIDSEYRSISTNGVFCDKNSVQSSDYNFQVEQYKLLIHISCAPILPNLGK